MKRIHLTTLNELMLTVPTLSSAQFKDFLKNVAPKKESGEKKGGNKTEDLIFGGLKTLKAMAPIGYKEEMAIGGAVALIAAARFGGLVEAPAVEKYLATLGNAIASTSDRPEIPYYFGILNTDEPNAFAAPGGYIFVSKGLLKLLKNEAELAGVLAHEIAHVTAKHALDSIRRSKIVAGASEVTLTALDKDPKTFDALINETVSLLFEQGLGRTKELQADQLGTEFAFRVGYNPTGLQGCLATLKGAVAATKRGLFKTHPDPGDRLSHLSIILGQPLYQGSGSHPMLADRFNASVGPTKL
jgi:predicted Zn-dependent protease